jgi:hypothetical protein
MTLSSLIYIFSQVKRWLSFPSRVRGLTGLDPGWHTMAGA